MAPMLTIELEIEAAPVVRVSAMSESEERRLMDWIVHQDAIVDLVCQAIELAHEKPAA